MSFVLSVVHASLFVKFIIFLLIVLGVWSWGVFFEKLTLFKVKETLSNAFRKEFYSGEMLDKIYNKLSVKSKIHAPLARVFFTGMKELNMSNVRNIDFASKYSDDLKKNIRERIFSSISVERARIISELRTHINSLATIASIAPFIGLLGTSWGIMDTLYSINDIKIVTITSVMPGVADAIISTVCGIGISISSIVFYNILTARLNSFISDSEMFGTDLANILSRELDIITTNAYQRKLDEMREKRRKLPQNSGGGESDFNFSDDDI
jgi:biopolymer transport protein TolQ